MKFDGLHHITMITADAPRNVEFYAGVLGLRLVKKTVNFDAPDSYHLYFGDEQGTPGSILTWFEFRDAAAGRPGAGMIHLIELAVGAGHALEFWEQRLRAHGCDSVREEGRLRFDDPDGLALALVATDHTNPPQRAQYPDIPTEHAITGIHAARAYTPAEVLAESHELLTSVLGFTDLGGGEYRLDGGQRQFGWTYDPAPAAVGQQGAGSVHHIAWACPDADQPVWLDLVHAAAQHVTPVLDREYFTSIYFREPRHVLFEIATAGPGFAVDEDPEHLGEQLRLPPQHEHLRQVLEERLTPIVNPRAGEGDAVA
jgi:glyoxalase family protein